PVGGPGGEPPEGGPGGGPPPGMPPGAGNDVEGTGSGGSSDGSYSSGDAESATTDDGTYLRGAQPTDAAGIAYFTTIFPGAYTGRTTPIHVQVHIDKKTVLTTQPYFDDDTKKAVYRPRRTPITRAGSRTPRTRTISSSTSPECSPLRGRATGIWGQSTSVSISDANAAGRVGIHAGRGWPVPASNRRAAASISDSLSKTDAAAGPRGTKLSALVTRAWAPVNPPSTNAAH